MKNFSVHTVGKYSYYTKEPAPSTRLIPHWQGEYLYYTLAEIDDGKNHSDIKPSAFTQR